MAALHRQVGDGLRLRANLAIQLLSSMFFRNKGGGIIGKIANGFAATRFAPAVLHHEQERRRIDAALFAEDDLALLFSFASGYFMLEMAIPSAHGQFLRSKPPPKPGKLGKLATPRTEEEEMSGKVGRSVGPPDSLPETFEPVLLGNPAVREVFMQHHADLLDAGFWQNHQFRIQAGHAHDVELYGAHPGFAQTAPAR